MSQALEHHEHAEHAAHQGNRRAALLVAVLAALLAVTEQGAKNAEIRVEETSIGAADSWAQYQAKSIRATVARDLADVVALLGEQTPGVVLPQRAALIQRLHADQADYETGTKDGKLAIAARARKLEHDRDHAIEQTHAFDNAAAAFELGIVLSTASAITMSGPLLIGAAGVGAAGVVLAILGMTEPALGAL